DLVLAGLDAGPIGADFAGNFDAQIGRMLNMVHQFRRRQEGFRGNTALIQAGSTEMAFLDQSNASAHLPGLQRGHVTTGSATDDDNVKMLTHTMVSCFTARVACRSATADSRRHVFARTFMAINSDRHATHS